MWPRRRSVGAAAGTASGAGGAGESFEPGGDAQAPPLTIAQLRARAIALLARRDHSRAELERKLARHSPDAGRIAQVLDQLQTEKLLSDQRFAEGVVRVRSARYGSLRVAQDLRARGVTGEMASSLVTSLKASEAERAREIWQRKFGSPPQDGAERARQMRFLQARGFAPDVIRRVVPRAQAGAEDDTE